VKARSGLMAYIQRTLLLTKPSKSVHEFMGSISAGGLKDLPEGENPASRNTKMNHLQNPKK
jgi:hypothetical protein